MNNNQEPSLMSLFNQESTTNPPTTVPPTIPTQPPTVPTTVPTEPVMISTTPMSNPTPSQHPIPTESRIIGEKPSIDDELLSEFVGGDYRKFSDGGFNAGAFFFGTAYYFYRKMFVIGIALYAITIFLAFFLNAGIVSAVMELLMTFTASTTYYNFAVKKVQEIQQKNPNATREELVQICRKSGGTSFLYAILGYILSFGFLIILLFLLVLPRLLFNKGGYSIPVQNTNERSQLVIQDFESPFKKRDASTQDYFYYDENGVNRNCKMSLEKTYYLSMDEALDYYQGYSKQLVVEKKNINDLTWNVITFDKGEMPGIEKTHIYLTEIDGSIFLFKSEFRNGGPEDCLNYEPEFINHIQKKIS